MKQVFISEKIERTFLDNVGMSVAVFLKKEGKLAGMIVEESGRWISRIGGSYGIDGFHTTRELCAKSAVNYGYELFIED